VETQGDVRTCDPTCYAKIIADSFSVNYLSHIKFTMERTQSAISKHVNEHPIINSVDCYVLTWYEVM